MYTSLAILTLANFIAPSPAPFSPHWLGDYWTAQKRAQKEQKPLAIFVGAGQKGFNQLSWEGNLTKPIQKILAEHYVCLYLDTTQKAGQDLAEDFEITKGLGLVISDRTGKIQAYHHDGGLAASALAARLQKFADPDLEVQTTESNSRTSYYQGSGQGSGQNNTQPAAGRSC
jgi:hypothetical protein